MNQDENMKDSRYDQALERAKELHEAGNSLTKAQMEIVFPELKESEDERIRKELLKEIEFISPHDGETDGEGLILPSYHARIDRYKSYLEKQKEQKPFMCDGEIEDKKRDIVAAIRKYYPADYAAYLTSFLKRLSPEDNSEDEYGQEMLGIAYKLMYEHIPENLRTQEFWDSLKFMREYTGKVAIIHSYEQPAEWSEEEKKHLYNAIEAVKYVYDVSEGTGGFKCVEFLKSLRPQPHWKPSKEQMDHLAYAYTQLKLQKCYAPHVYESLGSLYDDLKKLI